MRTHEPGTDGLGGTEGDEPVDDLSFLDPTVDLDHEGPLELTELGREALEELDDR
jgi:hypothetical protein